MAEADQNPSILADVRKLLAAGSEPKLVLRLLFTGRTEKEPRRKSTNFSRLLGWGLLDGARIHPELATIKHYAKAHGPGYLGELVADELISNGLADAEHMVDFELPELWDLLRGNDWRKFDPYNHILKPIQEQGPCGRMQGTTVRPAELSRVWKDPLNNQRLPPILTALLAGLGLPHKGPDSISDVLIKMNNFVMYHAGAGERRRNALLDAAAKLMEGVFKEAGANVNRVRDLANLEAPELVTLLDPTGDEHGARRAWREMCTRTKKANDLQREVAMMEMVAPSVESEGIKTFLYTGDGQHDDKRLRTGDAFPMTKSGTRRARSRSRDGATGGGGGGRGGNGGGGCSVNASSASGATEMVASSLEGVASCGGGNLVGSGLAPLGSSALSTMLALRRR